MYKIFSSIDKLHYISITITENTAYFRVIECDYENIKTFLLLLKECMEYLKDNNIKIVRQEIVKEEFELFKYSNIMDKTNSNNVMIETKIKDFINELINVFDIKLSSKI